MTRVLSFLLCFLLMVSPSAHANLLGANMVSEKVVCAPAGDESVLSEQGVDVQGGDPEDKRSVVTALSRLQELSGGTFPYFKNKKVIFQESIKARDKQRGCLGGRENGGSIELALNTCPEMAANCKWKGIPADQCPAPGTPLVTNATTIIHEIGHRVGNTNGLYAKYRGFQKSECSLTKYCQQSSPRSPHGEEFSEAFALFATKPSELQRLCPGAYKFFKDEVFKMAADPGDCGAGKLNPPRRNDSDPRRPLPIPRERLEHDADETPGTAADCEPGASDVPADRDREAPQQAAFDFNTILKWAPLGVGAFALIMQARQAREAEEARMLAAQQQAEQMNMVSLFGPFPLSSTTTITPVGTGLDESQLPASVQDANGVYNPYAPGR